MDWRLLSRVILLLITLSIPAAAIFYGLPELLVFLIPVIIYQVWELIQYIHKTQYEFSQFIESVHNRDFSRQFNERYPDMQVQLIRKGFNEINAALKSISRERESQHLHLQMIMELVDTGIFSFDTGNGEVMLMNETVKKLLQLPYMKSIHYLEKRDPLLFKAIQEIQPGQSKIATANSGNLEKNSFKVLLSATSFQSDGHSYKLIAFQNVSEALDETESQAWQKLLSVLTHEIMNSVAPIASLADTLKTRLHESAGKQPSVLDMEDFELGVSTIKSRSLGLLRFAETYRNLNKITALNLSEISIKELFLNLKHLMYPTLAQKHIKLEVYFKNPDLSVQADANLLDQVLINLIMNAIEAVKKEPAPLITLSAYETAAGKTVIKVTDNGSGIPNNVQDKIFIPFFSTKKNGSGIGLSLCKQIMLLHQGSIQVQSEEEAGTSFILRFK